jgi:gustatory receptor
MLAVILMCDTIKQEFDNFLAHSYQIKNEVMDFAIKEHEVGTFIKAVSRCSPEFTAARYFSVDRSTIFAILNSMTTFLLVMIQLK